MIAFSKKYYRAILYWTILLFFLFYYAPRQSKYYLEDDITQFKELHLIPILIWTFGIIAFGLFVYWFIKTKSAKKSSFWFLSTGLTFAFVILFFQNIFLGFALFANRQVTQQKITKTYQASFMAGTDHLKNNFSPYEPSTKRISNDIKLVNELYHSGLKQNDTLVLTMNEGLFGVAFSSHPFDDKK